MRRQIGAVALATAALLTLSGVVSGSAHASAPAVAPADTSPAPVGDGSGTDAAAIDAATAAANASANDRELALLRGDREAADLLGYMPSLYQGKWYMPGKEDVRRCIMERESHANYRANGGAYFGAYQMSRALGEGAAWMMLPEIRKEFGREGVAIVTALRSITPDRWNRYWQDRAFWTIWRLGAGARNWGGGAHDC